MTSAVPRFISMRLRSVLTLCWFSMLTACAGHQQSVVDPAGPQSGKIATLWWFFFYLLGAIFLTVMVLLIGTLMRRQPRTETAAQQENHSVPEETESKLTRVVTGATIVTVLILFVLLIASIGTGKATADLGRKPNLLKIEVTGNQWWWQFRYLSDDPSQTLTTANEIHIPVGRTVLIQGMSNDVIHSFWVPNLHGKRDLIPSRVTTEYIQADKPGVYRGQCAEFCGLQHAHMSFYVIAEPEDKFEAWMQAQLQPTPTPANATLKQGQQSFL
ncbi:MAG: cytochrome c oxidase subunit II, partial [Acidobacteriota bacterium]|nr:cytochrome c oxidase subunit II [Acidobacteriota bacterium]